MKAPDIFGPGSEVPITKSMTLKTDSNDSNGSWMRRSVLSKGKPNSSKPPTFFSECVAKGSSF